MITNQKMPHTQSQWATWLPPNIIQLHSTKRSSDQDVEGSPPHTEDEVQEKCLHTSTPNLGVSRNTTTEEREQMLLEWNEEEATSTETSSNSAYTSSTGVVQLNIHNQDVRHNRQEDSADILGRKQIISDAKNLCNVTYIILF